MTKQNKIKIGLLILFLLYIAKKTARKIMQKFTAKSFIDFITPDLITIGNRIGVPYKFLVAQVCLETGFGKSSLFTKYYNVGGIKAVKNQAYVTLPTYEYIDNKKVQILAKFAKYPDLKTGLEGYAKIFQNRYFRQYLNKTTDPKEFAKLLQSGKVKYATDIAYTGKINKIIDNYLS